MTAVIDRAWPDPAGDLSDDALLHSFDVGARPWLRVNFVSSVDGAVTGDDGLSGGLGGDADRRVFDLLRRLCDVVLVGAGTVRAESYGPMRLSDTDARWREAHGLAAHPVFAIVSGSLDLDPASRIFTDAPVQPIVVTTERASSESRARFAEVADVVVAGSDTLDVGALVAALHARGLTHVHCEGGPSLFGSLLAANAVDELCLTVSPLLQGSDARRLSTGPLGGTVPLDLAHVLVSDDTLLLRYLAR